MIGFRAMLFGFLLPLVPIGAAWAAPSIVQSGEHGTFTRLVASLPQGATWSAKWGQGELVLTLLNHSDGFRVDQIYKRIGRERIASAIQDQSKLTLIIPCDCNVSAFSVGSDHVAIDVVDDDAEYDLPFLKEIDLGARGETADFAKQAFATVPSFGSGLLPTTLPRGTLSVGERFLLTNVQQQLAKRMVGAASGGIVNSKMDYAMPLATSTIEPEDAPQGPARTPEDDNDIDYRNMRITTSNDMPELDLGTDQISSSGLVCPEPLDIESWSTGEPFHIQIGKLRKTLVAEFDRLNSQKAVKLAKTYLYFGFGAEAEKALSLDPDLARDNRLLMAIAKIMEEGEARHYPELPDYIDCDSDVVLWAALAQRRLTRLDTENIGAILQTLDTLPAHLRSFLAPELSRRFRSENMSEAAAAVLRSLERLPGNLPSSAALAKANVALDEGQDEDAQAQLTDIIDSNGHHVPQALIALVEAKFRQGQPIDAETASLVSSYAKELQGSALGTNLHRANVLALLKSNQFEKAFQIRNATKQQSNPTQQDELEHLMIAELLHEADDVTFLEVMYQQDNDTIQELPKALQLTLARRYLSLGFTPAAQSVLDAVPMRPRDTERQLIAAQIALALERPALAQAELIEVETEEADLLRARAKAMSGAHDQAHMFYEQTNRPEDAARNAWLAEDWRVLIEEDTPVFGPFAALSESTVRADPQPQGMLSRTSTALRESGDARALLEKLLRDPALQIETTARSE